MKNKVLPVLLTLSLSLGFSLSYIPKVMSDDIKQISISIVSKEDYIQKLSDNADINWTKQTITVTGAGAPPEKGSAGQKRLMALRAAKVDAFRQLLEVIEGVHVNSETTVKDFVVESDVIKTKIEGLVKGAQQVGEPKYISDGSVEIVMGINLFGEKSVASAVMPQEIKNDVEKPQEETKLEPATVEETYTSLIVDCSGLDVQPAMSPAIFDEDGGEVYVSNLPIDPDQVINDGITRYTRSTGEAKSNEKAGNNPLIIKAIKVKGLFKSDLTISNADTKKLIGAEEKGKFLKEFKVIMVLK